MWPKPISDHCTERTDHEDSQPVACAIRSPRPSNVLEMFLSHQPEISVDVGASQIQTPSSAGGS